jgi:hypothetical protein
MSNNKFERAPLDREQVDSLRLETQRRSPEDFNKLKKVVSECDDAVRGFIKEYIDLDKNKDIAQRFLELNSNDLKEFVRHWETDSKLKKLDDGVPMFFMYPERLIAGSVRNPWAQLSEKTKKIFADKVGGPEKARKILYAAMLRQTIAHELVHSYQDIFLPVWLREAGAYYYAAEISTIMSGMNLCPCAGAIDLYRKLKEKFGNDVDLLSFGKAIDPQVESAIFSEFTPEKISEALPDYQL